MIIQNKQQHRRLKTEVKTVDSDFSPTHCLQNPCKTLTVIDRLRHFRWSP